MKIPRTQTLRTDRFEMDYVRFGHGEKTLVMIPGLTLNSVRGSAAMLACLYRIFAKVYTVYLFDRKKDFPEGYSVKDIADDLAYAMHALQIESADVIGISQGGMAVQVLAIKYPNLVHKLVLGVTLSKENDTVRDAVRRWIRLAEEGDDRALVVDIMESMYSERYIRRYRWLFPILTKIGRPKDPQRFIRLAEACLTCDTFDRLDQIRCPVFVIGGKQDRVVTGAASEEIAGKLGCACHLYEEFGHAAYEEAKDFNQRVLNFLTEPN